MYRDKRPRYWVDAACRDLFDWLIRWTSHGGLYMGLRQFEVPVHNKAGHVVLMMDCPRRITLYGKAFKRLSEHYQDVLIQKYFFIRNEDHTERTDSFRAQILRMPSKKAYENAVKSARKAMGEAIDQVEGEIRLDSIALVEARLVSVRN